MPSTQRMTSIARAAFVALVVLVAACGRGAAPSPSAPLVPSPDPNALGYWLRVTTTQAIPPLNLFEVLPQLVITGDGVVVMPGPQMELYPGPLVPSLTARTISEAGRAAILKAAADLGLLGDRTDFTGSAMPPGAVTGRIGLTMDGRRVVLTGNPSAHIECVTTPCNPPPGSPEAFGELWRRLLDLPGWLGPELGAEAPYVATSYALLVGPAPMQDPGLPQAPKDWPLDVQIGSFGSPVANGNARCGTVSGSAADTLRPALAAANALTQWVQDPSLSATFGLTVRPMVPGEDVCSEIFGPG